MVSGYTYGEGEPKERCPYCQALCCADFVDVGIGYVQCGPYHCERCGASEMGPNDNGLGTEAEREVGWFGPGQPPSPDANVDENGNHIRHFEADTLYRASVGVGPRYTQHGRLL